MTLTAYVTYAEGEETFTDLLKDGVGVDPMGCLFLVTKKNDIGGIAEGRIVAPGVWLDVEITTDQDPEEPAPV
jgi:hypothetical protein